MRLCIPQNSLRTDKDIERSIFKFDPDHELALASNRGFLPRPLRRSRSYGRKGSFLTGTVGELIYSNSGAGSPKGTFQNEFQINDTVGMGSLCTLPANFFLPSRNLGQTVRIVARGIVAGVTTNTWQWNFRFNPTVTPANPPTGPIVAGNPGVITPGNVTVTTSLWECEADVQFTVAGAAGNNSTLRGLGFTNCPGFGTPTVPANLALYGGGASPGTVATFDWSLLNTLTVGVLSGASSSSNTITCLQLLLFGLN